MPRFEHACRTIQGARRYQEDKAEVRPRPVAPIAVGDSAATSDTSAAPNTEAEVVDLVAVLADGMGGHAGGALASEATCAAFLEGFEARAGVVVDRLARGLEAANRAVADKVAAEPWLAGMGATLVGAAFGEAGLEWVSVGDSPMYLWRRGEIAVVNEDHSLAPVLDRLVAEGRLSAADARTDPRRHHLRSAVTGEEIDLVDTSRKALALEPGDCVILASDGIHTLSEARIAEIVTNRIARGAGSVAELLMDSVAEARDPLQDNTTVVVVHMTSW